jgi:tRNA A-37 threonylcarbamoyl transferase component Bud32
MRRTVALKVMHPRLLDRPAAVTQFAAEVRAAARLSHPHIVTAYDAEQAGDVHFLVMEYVAGASLDRVVAERGPLPLAEACAYVRQAALGLQHAFEHGMVHRDIKPANILLASVVRSPSSVVNEPIVKILDFGLARIAQDAADAGGGVDAAGSRRAALTGTPDYIAPEQAVAPQQADTRADIYSLGCTLFYLLTGRPPFRAATREATVAAHLRQPPPAIRALRSDVLPAAAAILERMLAKEPALRYSTPAEVARALTPYTAVAAPAPAGRAARRRTWRWVGLTVGAVAVAMLLAGIAMRWRDDPPAIEPPVHAAAQPPSLVEPPAQPASLPPSPPAVAPQESKPAPAADVPAAPRTQALEQMVAWLQENNVFGPDHSFVRRQRDKVAQQFAEGRRVELSIGPGLLRTGKATLLTTRGGRLFIHEYSDAEVLAIGLRAKETLFKDVPDHRDAIQATPAVELSDLRIDDADAIDAHRHITGSVAYRVRGPYAGPLALRLHKAPKRGMNGYDYLKTDLDAQGGSLSFRFASLDSAGSFPPTALPVFLDLLTVRERGRPDHATVVSNTLIAVVIVAPPQ